MYDTTSKHKYPWEGSPLVTRVSAKCYIGQRSGLLFAETRVLQHGGNRREFVQKGAETPMQFWTRVVSEVCGKACEHCGHEITDEAATAAHPCGAEGE